MVQSSEAISSGVMAPSAQTIPLYRAYESQPMVIDVGSHSVRVGYSGESFPHRVLCSIAGIASTYGNLFPQTGGVSSSSLWSTSSPPSTNILSGSSQLSSSPMIYPLNPLEKRDHVELVYPIQAYLTDEGKCVYNYNYNCIEKILDRVVGSKGLNDPLSDHPILFTEPNITNHKYRESIMEMIFETFQAPSLFLSKLAPLMAYAVAKTSGLILDIGATSCVTCVLVEGYVIPKSVVQTPIAGDLLTQYINTLVNKSFTSQYIEQGETSKSSSPFITPLFAYDHTFNSSMIHNSEDKSNTSMNQSITPQMIVNPYDFNLPSFTQSLPRDEQGHVKLIACPFVSPSYMQWGRQYISDLIKTKINFVYNNPIPSTSKHQHSDGSLELPDGKIINMKFIENAQKCIPDLMFSPHHLMGSEYYQNVPISSYYQNPFSLSSTSIFKEGSEHAHQQTSASYKLPSQNASHTNPSQVSNGTTHPVSSFLQNIKHSHPNIDLSSILKQHSGGIANQLFLTLQNSELHKHTTNNPHSGHTHTNTNITTHSHSNLSETIITAGGSTLYNGFLQRLQLELNTHQKFNSFHNQFKVVASNIPHERQFASWIGGSVLSCLGSFPKFCVSAEEYNELGARQAAEKKFS